MEFVNFEIAKRLKNLSYNEPFFFFYRTDDQLLHHAMVSKSLVYGDYVDNEVVIAPTISQVLKWLRKEKGLHIAIDIWGKTWGYDIIELSSGNSLHWTAYREDIKSYEDAALDGIKYIINNLI